MDEFPPTADAGDVHIKLTKKAVCGGPVTHVQFVGDGFVYALGGWLHRSWDSIGHLVFSSGGIIHGLATPGETSQYSLVFGGKQIAFIQGVMLRDKPIRSLELRRRQHDSSTRNDLYLPQYQLELADWIWDARFLAKNDRDESIGEDGSKKTLVVGLAHHILEVMHVGFGDTVDFKKLHRIVANPACLVTSTNLFSCTLSNKLWVAAGTSFQDIVVWTVDLNTVIRSNGAKQCVMQEDPLNLSGHTGVVHSVQFSSNGSTLASTSDDRSVRLWKKKPNEDATDFWELEWTGWGHTARVWSVVFSPTFDAVVTSGEDNTVRVWSQAGGQQLAVLNLPSGSAWCVDIRDSQVLIGGNNGTITLEDLSCHISSEINQRGLVQSCTVLVPDDRSKAGRLTDAIGSEERDGCDEDTPTELSAEEPKKKRKKKSKKKSQNVQVIVGMKWLDCNASDLPHILVATRMGSLMSLSVNDQVWTELAPWWESSLQTTSGVACTDGCCMAVHPDGQNIAIGTTRGDIILTKSCDIEHVPSTNVLSSGREYKSVQGLHWVNSTTLLSFHVRTTVVWTLPVDLGKGVIETESISYTAFCSGIKAVPISFAYDSACGRLIIGDSRGNIALFQLDENAGTNESKLREPAGVLNAVHQKEHVQELLLDSNRIISVGNDGSLHVSYIEGVNLRRGFSFPVGSLSGLERIWRINHPIVDSTNTLLVGGYFGNIFVVMDLKSGVELFRVDTGGRQRSAECFIGSSPAAGTYDCIYGLAVCANRKDGRNELLIRHNASQTRKALAALPNLRSLKNIGLHIETIYSVCLFSLYGSLLLLAGSEDCTSSISICGSPGEQGELLDSMSLTPQESCVRAVCSSQQDDSSALLVVGGGKLVLQFFLVRKATSDSILPVTCRGLDVTLLGYGKTRANATIDHRINTVKAVPLQGTRGKHIVLAGDSDGNCHIYLVQEDICARHTFGYIKPVGPRPILSLDVLEIGPRLLLLIGTTAGEVILWDVPGDSGSFKLTEHGSLDLTAQIAVHPLGTYQAHQMGTNTIQASVLKREQAGDKLQFSILICSGGDDQAICVCEATLSLQNDGKLSIEKPLLPFITKEASSSAVKGVAVFPTGGERGVATILSVGYSQRLAAWQYSSEKQGKLALLTSNPIDVGDVNCLDYHEGVTAVGGFGIELTSVAQLT